MKPVKKILWPVVAVLFLGWAPGVSWAQISFDLRNVGGVNYVTPVKNQSELGCCWSFAAYGSMESNLLMQGLVGSPTAPEANLSEWHMATRGGYNNPCYTYSTVINPVTGEPYGYSPPGTEWGGNADEATLYLARGSGAVLNSSAPYPLSDIQAHLTLTPPAVSLPTSWRLKQMQAYQATQYGSATDFRSAVKTALKTNGAMDTSLFWDDASYNSSNHTYYYSGNSTSTNHAVTIAGWDDTKTTASAAPGAWLIKNSWGDTWGDNGYFWLAYDSKTAAATADSFIAQAKPVNMLMYNNTTAVHNMLWSVPYTAARFVTGRTGEELQSVGFFVNLDNVGYELRIYDTKEGNTFSGQLGSTLTGTVAKKGYDLVDFSSRISLGTPGNDYYVWLQFSGFIGDVQSYVGSTGGIANTTFYSWDNITWDDGAASNSIFDLKVATVPEPGTLLFLSLGTVGVMARRRKGRQS